VPPSGWWRLRVSALYTASMDALRGVRGGGGTRPMAGGVEKRARRTRDARGPRYPTSRPGPNPKPTLPNPLAPHSPHVLKGAHHQLVPLAARRLVGARRGRQLRLGLRDGRRLPGVGWVGGRGARVGGRTGGARLPRGSHALWRAVGLPPQVVLFRPSGPPLRLCRRPPAPPRAPGSPCTAPWPGEGVGRRGRGRAVGQGTAGAGAAARARPPASASACRRALAAPCPARTLPP
jgi:hypothetical protein